MSTHQSILVVNCGSSSLKFAVFGLADGLDRLLWGAASGIGTEQGRLRVMEARGQVLANSDVRLEDHTAAIAHLDEILRQQGEGLNLIGIGHRVVHGGADCDCSQRIDDTLLRRLKTLIPLAPLHLPHNLAGIAAMRAHFPDVPQTLDPQRNREPESLISAAEGLVQVEAVTTDEEQMIARHVQRLYTNQREDT